MTDEPYRVETRYHFDVGGLSWSITPQGEELRFEGERGNVHGGSLKLVDGRWQVVCCDTHIRETLVQEIEAYINKHGVPSALHPNTVDQLKARLRTRSAQLQAHNDEVKRLREVLETIRDDFDCDVEAHRYKTCCRCCAAAAALAGASGDQIYRAGFLKLR